MRMLCHVKLPNKEFNAYINDGSISQKLKRILDDIKPQAVYFTEYEGKRGAIIIVDVPEPSAIPKMSEAWFVLFNAEVEWHIVMTPDELEKAGLEKVAKKWM
jgi:hypothetical protein